MSDIRFSSLEIASSPEAVQANFDRLGARLGLLDLLAGFRLVRGVIDGTGTAAILEGSGFSLTDNGTGDYTITFDPTFSDRPAVCVWPVSGARASSEHASSPANGTAVRVQIYTTTTGANVDSPFHFIAIGPA